MKKFLIVYAHPEQKSFCGAIKNTTVNKLKSLNNEVLISDLYADNFNPVVSNSDFKKLKNKEYFQYLNEQIYSYENKFTNYSDEVQKELEKFKWADNLIFIFPMWWGSYPAIMKGWIDKCLVYGHSWTIDKTFSKGIFKDKKAMAVVTCDDTKENYSKEGLQGMTIEEMLHHFNTASMRFVGITALKPYAFYKVSQHSYKERQDLLKEYEIVLENFK